MEIVIIKAKLGRVRVSRHMYPVANKIQRILKCIDKQNNIFVENKIRK